MSKVLAMALLCLLPACGHNEGPAQNEGPAADFYAAIYPAIRETGRSDMNEVLTATVQRRLACYENTFAFGDRLADCQSAYLLDILLAARSHIPSAPLLGECILSLKLCPIAYGMCRGELTAPDEAECIHREVQAIEHVLDNYWRGNTLPQRTF
ncbi:MAG: hypothetical protein WDA20_04980 [Desulfuromonadales bacterium]